MTDWPEQGLVILAVAMLVSGLSACGRTGSPEGASRPSIQIFRDCEDCPLMVVLEPGTFIMGTPESEPKSTKKERPQHEVAIAYRLAVSKFETTMSEWDTCVRAGGCNGYEPDDNGWGRISCWLKVMS